MKVATWNLNNRVGSVRFRPEAAAAACSLDADVIAFTEYYPQQHHAQFVEDLSRRGWTHSVLSVDTSETANRVLVASRLPVSPVGLDLPTFDGQLPANVACVDEPVSGVRILAIRVPAYKHTQSDELRKSWEWLSATAAELSSRPALIIGDLNVQPARKRGANAEHFQRLLESGWIRVVPDSGYSYRGREGNTSEIDHVLASRSCNVGSAEYVITAGGYELVGSGDAISDHAALVVEVGSAP